MAPHKRNYFLISKGIYFKMLNFCKNPFGKLYVTRVDELIDKDNQLKRV